MIQLNNFKNQPHKFTEAEWAAVDQYHGYQWWDACGDPFPLLQSVAAVILSKAVAASACEFNWSAVGLHELKGRQLLTPNTNKVVKVAAAHKLRAHDLANTGSDSTLPELDDVIRKLTDDAEDGAPLHVSCPLDLDLDALSNENVDHLEEEEEGDDGIEQLDLYKDWNDRESKIK